jgi:hypothetical protein
MFLLRWFLSSWQSAFFLFYLFFGAMPCVFLTRAAPAVPGLLHIAVRHRRLPEVGLTARELPRLPRFCDPIGRR